MNSTDALRKIALKWGSRNSYAVNKIIIDEMVSDLTALISEHYVEREKYDEAVRQRDELKEALAAMVDQFAYRIKSSEAETLHTMGLSALEDAFDALKIPDAISQKKFEAAIKNTER
jgi:N-acetylglutamate synthase/N-acetylornithine aminotransferase